MKAPARLAALVSFATFGAIFCLAHPAAAALITVSPADGNTAYTKIEGAHPGDEVVLAPGTYAFRVYLQQQATAASPLYIHSQDPSNPAIVDPSSASGGLVDNAPGSYTAGDKARGCWQVSGAANIHIDGIVFQNCHAASHDSAGIRYYGGTTGLLITNSVFKGNDNGLTGGTVGADGTTQSEVTVEWSEFSGNGNTAASSSSPTHNIYVYGGIFTLRYSYLHDPVQAQNLHCRAITSTIEYNWMSRAKSYTGDLMTNDDYANNPTGSLTQSMTFRGNVIFEGTTPSNTSQIWAVYNDEASGSPVTFRITMAYNTLIGAGGHAALVHLSNSDGTTMTAELDDNLVSGSTVADLVEDTGHATVTGSNNWLQTGTSTTGLTGSVLGASPGFTAAASDNFVPLATSPCVGAANDTVAALPVAEYYENETTARMFRARASAHDIGAFEHDTTGAGIGPYGGGDGGVTTAGDSGTTSGGGGSASGGGGQGSGDAGNANPDPGTGDATTRDPDAAAGASDDGGGSSGGGGGGGQGSQGGTGAASSKSGCGCRLVAAAGTGGGAVWALALAGLLYRRRRARRSY